jgi:UTP--glucose-1-phosphate uridylyltransferase
MNRITKAVFPVAGLGTRFLPATKASPKEMMPIVDKPLIQHAVEEAISAGISEMIFVTGRNKRAIEDHFDKAHELEATLGSRGKTGELEALRGFLPKSINCIFVRQAEALGLGHAILCAKPVVGREPFAVMLADDLIDAQPCVLTQMIAEYRHHRCSIVGVQNVGHGETDQYGIVSCGARFGPALEVMNIVEKPRPSEAPSTLGVVGRYILTPAIFDHLQNVVPGAGGEMQLTDAIATLLGEERVLAYQFKGTRYDCGSKLGYLKATLAYGLAHPEVGADFALHLENLTLDHASQHGRNLRSGTA